VNKDNHDDDLEVPGQNSGDVSVDKKSDRREALRRIGKYSAYAVPALLALTNKSAAAY
jgi:hypothetical protein